VKEVYSKFNDQGKELEQQIRALAAMSEKFEEATKAAEESERCDILNSYCVVRKLLHDGRGG